MAQSTVVELQNIGDTEKARYTHCSLHTATPGTTGASEATGGSPAYARKAITWGSASSADPTVVTGTQVTFDVAAGTYTHWGYWSASSGGTFRIGGALSATQVLGAQGTIPFTPSFTVTAA